MLMTTKIGQLLVNNHLITEEHLGKALELQKKEGGLLGSNLVKLGFISEEKLVAFLSQQYGVPAVNLSDYKIDNSLTKFIPAEVAQKYLMMPVARLGATLTVAMVDPSNVFAIDDVKVMTGYNVEPVVAAESAIRNAITECYGQIDALQTAMDNFKMEEGELLAFVREEGEDEDLGELKLDREERRLPQDGRINLKIKGREVDLRVSTLPTLFGEKIVMRILDKGSLVLDLTKLGFEQSALKDFEEAISSPVGMALVTGPTGSGKTTKLYSALSQKK